MLARRQKRTSESDPDIHGAKTSASSAEARELASAEKVSISDEEFERMFAEAGWDAQVAAAEQESALHLAELNASYSDISEEMGDLLGETAKALEANSGKMRATLEDAGRRARSEITAFIEGDGDAEKKTDALKTLAVMHPDAVMDALPAFGKMLDFGQKARVAAYAIEHDVSAAARLGEAGFTETERRAVLIRLAVKAPRIFPKAARAAGLAFGREELRAITLMAGENDASAFAELSRELGFSHGEIAGMLRDLPGETAAKALETLQIPDAKGASAYEDFTHDESGRKKEEAARPEMREGYEQMRQLERASRDLMLAIAAEFPDRADRDLERYVEERKLHGVIERFGEIGRGSLTAPLFLVIEDRELPVVYKPIGREAISFKDGGFGRVRAGIELGGLAPREVLAALIDRALGTDLVPATVLRDGPEGVGSVQEWRVGTLASALENNEWHWPKHHDGLKRVGYFDFLTNHSDRHAKNWLVGFDGKFTAIDNGPIFAAQQNVMDKRMSLPLSVVKGAEFPADLRAKAVALLGSTKTREALRRAFVGALGDGDGEQYWSEFVGRLEESAREGFRMPDTEWMIPSPGETEKWRRENGL